MSFLEDLDTVLGSTKTAEALERLHSEVRTLLEVFGAKNVPGIWDIIDLYRVLESLREARESLAELMDSDGLAVLEGPRDVLLEVPIVLRKESCVNLMIDYTGLDEAGPKLVLRGTISDILRALSMTRLFRPIKVQITDNNGCDVLSLY